MRSRDLRSVDYSSFSQLPTSVWHSILLCEWERDGWRWEDINLTLENFVLDMWIELAKCELQLGAVVVVMTLGFCNNRKFNERRLLKKDCRTAHCHVGRRLRSNSALYTLLSPLYIELPWRPSLEHFDPIEKSTDGFGVLHLEDHRLETTTQ